MKTTEQGLMAGLSRGQPEDVGIFSEYLDLSRFPGGSVWGRSRVLSARSTRRERVPSSSLASHLPVDLVVIMLGSNDLRPVFNRTPLRIAIGAARLIDLACFNRWSRRFTPHVRIREKARSCRCREGEGDFEVDIPCPADRPVYGRCFRRLIASSPAGTVSNKLDFVGW